MTDMMDIFMDCAIAAIIYDNNHEVLGQNRFAVDDDPKRVYMLNSGIFAYIIWISDGDDIYIDHPKLDPPFTNNIRIYNNLYQNTAINRGMILVLTFNFILLIYRYETDSCHWQTR